MYAYQIYVFQPVDYDGHGTFRLETRCVRSTHARNTLRKSFGRQAQAEYVDVSPGNVRHKLCVSKTNIAYALEMRYEHATQLLR